VATRIKAGASGYFFKQNTSSRSTSANKNETHKKPRKPKLLHKINSHVEILRNSNPATGMNIEGTMTKHHIYSYLAKHPNYKLQCSSKMPFRCLCP